MDFPKSYYLKTQGFPHTKVHVVVGVGDALETELIELKTGEVGAECSLASS